jgi:hypothetical protein
MRASAIPIARAVGYTAKPIVEDEVVNFLIVGLCRWVNFKTLDGWIFSLFIKKENVYDSKKEKEKSLH